MLLSFLCFSSNAFSQIFVTDTAIPMAERLSCSSYFDSLQQRDIYLFADQKAQFPGGNQEMEKFIFANLQPSATDVFGTVYVSFVVEPNGNLSHKSIRKSVHKVIDQEAMRLLDKMPVWIPARCEGEAVPYAVTIPVKFYIR